MTTDNLSGAKGKTQSSVIIWLSLDPSLSLSGTSWHHPIANPLVLYLCLTSSSQSHWFPFSPFFARLQHPSPRLTVILFQVIIHYRCLLLLLLLLCRIVTLLTLFCIMYLLQSCGVLQYCVLWYIV